MTNLTTTLAERCAQDRYRLFIKPGEALRRLMQEMYDKRHLHSHSPMGDPVTGKPAVMFLMPDGPNGSDSSKVFGFFKDALRVLDPASADCKMTMAPVSKPGDLTYQVVITEELLHKLTTYKHKLETDPELLQELSAIAR